MKANMLKKLAVATVGVALTLSAVPSPASATVFNLEGTFTDGGTFSGSFDYDNQIQDVTSWNITTTQGFQLPGTTYTNTNASVRLIENEPGAYPINVLFLFTKNLDDIFTAPVGTLFEQDFQFIFPNQSLANFEGGLITSDNSAEAWFRTTGPGSGIGIARFSGTGSVTPTTVPEPSSSTLGLVAVCGYLSLLRKRKTQHQGSTAT